MTIANVQIGGNNAAASASVSQAFGANVAVGNLVIVVGARFNDAADPYVAADCVQSAGTATLQTPTLHLQTEVIIGGNRHDLGIWSAKVTVAGTCTMLVGGGDTNDFPSLGISEFSASNGWSDTAATRFEASNNASNSTGAPDSGNASSAGGAVFIGGLAVDTAILITITQDSAFTLIHESENGALFETMSSIYRIVTGATTDSASWTAPTTSPWSAIVGVFKEEAGAPAEQPPPPRLSDGDPDSGDEAAYGWCADDGVVARTNADAAVPGPALPDSFEWEEPNNDAALFEWPWSTGPPPETPADQHGIVEDSSLQPTAAEEEPFGFEATGLPEDIEDQIFFVDGGQPDDEDEAGTAEYSIIQPDGALDVPQPAPHNDQEEEPVTEDFGMAGGPLAEDLVEPRVPEPEFGLLQLGDEDEFLEAQQYPPLSDSNEEAASRVWCSDDQQPEDEFAESLVAGPQPEGVVEPVFVEDASGQPPDPEDEAHGFEAGPLPEDLVVQEPLPFCDFPAIAEERWDEGFGTDDGQGVHEDAPPAPPPPPVQAPSSSGGGKRRKLPPTPAPRIPAEMRSVLRDAPTPKPTRDQFMTMLLREDDDLVRLVREMYARGDFEPRKE